MGKLKANSFKGYTSKPGLINNPGLGTDCDNVLINRGDLCSYPTFEFHKRLIDGGVMDAFFHSQFGDEDLIIWKDGEGFFVLKDPSLPPEPIQQVNGPLNVSGFFNMNSINAAAGNWVQAGDWIFYLGLFRPVEGAIGKKPRMIRIHKRVIQGQTVPLQAGNYIGIAPPKRSVLFSATSNGIMVFTTGIDFAFTFITNDQRIGTETNALNFDDAESVGISLVVPRTIGSTGHKFTFRIYLPDGMDTLQPTSSPFSGVRVGMYMKRSSEADYTLVKYSLSQLPVLTELSSDAYPGEKYVEMVIGTAQGNFPVDDTPGTNMDDITNQGIVTASPGVDGFGRSIPPPSRHGIVYKKRMYYAPVPPSPNDPVPFWALNNLFYSQQMLGSGIQANYVDDFINIGSEASGFTGFVEYLGQLIIFKQKETWVMTDDVLTGAVRKLFSGIGCVNKNGGHGYIAIGAFLFFVDATGVYSWTGEGNPQKISEAIKEDLDAIPRDINHPLQDRYGYARLSHDPQYNLMYLTFPKVTHEQEVLPTFIFHLDEGGAWTKMSGDIRVQGEADGPRQISRIILAQSGNRYMLTRRRFMRLGKLDKVIIGEPSAPASWTGSILDGGAASRKKHWKFMNIASHSVEGLTVKLVDQDREEIQTLVVGDGNNRVKIGRHLNELGVQFEPSNIFQPFRIHNYELDVHLRGRR